MNRKIGAASAAGYAAAAFAGAYAAILPPVYFTQRTAVRAGTFCAAANLKSPYRKDSNL